MKNVSCFKLTIDRSNAPKKMGTFKDISLFGNYIFPLEEEYAGGIIAHSLAGVGKEVKKTKAQLQKISSRNTPMAGSTGSSISSELPPAREGESRIHQTQDETYSIRFINHTPEPLQTPSFIERGRTVPSLQPSNGYAVKKASRKRVVFSLEQKEIMISFYNRQAASGIRAEPKDVITCMQAQGVEVLKESQIISWWSTYHQKRKRLLTAEAEYLRGLHPSACNSGSTVPVQQPTPVCAPGPSMPVQQPTPVHIPGSSVPVQQPTPVHIPGSSVPVQQPARVCAPGPSMPLQQPTPVHIPGLSVPVQRPTPVRAPGSSVPVQQPTLVHIPGSSMPVQQPTPVRVPGPSVPVQQPTPVHIPGSSVPVQQPTPVHAPGSSVPVQQPTPVHAPGSSVPVQQPTPVHAPGSSVPVQQPTPVRAPGYSVPVQPSSCLMGYGVPGLSDILQWTFPANFCQSTLGGRSGSNACTFIALYFGHLYLHNNLPLPVNSTLSMEWKCALYKAMKKGNEIHDELFEGEGVDVSVEDAVDMAGTECFVQSIGQSFDVFGMDCEDQLAEVFEALSASSTLQSSCNVVVTTGRSVLFIANQDGSCMVVDSHKHGNMGAMISYCPPNCPKMLAKWLGAVIQGTWQCNLRVCSVTPIFYIAP